MLHESEKSTDYVRVRGINLSLQKALRILLCFSEEQPEWGVTELSRHLDLGKSTVSSMLSTLAMYGFVQQSSSTRRYHLGLRCLELGYLTSSRLIIRDLAYPYLEALLDQTNQIVYMGIPYESEILYIEALYPTRRRVNYSSQGRRVPLYCTSIGKAVLAAWPEERLDAYLKGRKLRKYTRKTVTDPAILKEELKEIQLRGYAVDLGHIEDGIHCVGASVRVSGNVVASISVSGPYSEITPANISQIGESVRMTANEISRKLAASGLDFQPLI